LKPADPELAALVSHARLRSGLRGGLQSTAMQQTGDEKQGDHHKAETEIGQSEIREQRDGALAAVAQVTTNTDEAFKLHISHGAVIETVGSQRMLRSALRTVVGPMTIGVTERFGVLLDGARERV